MLPIPIFCGTRFIFDDNPNLTLANWQPFFAFKLPCPGPRQRHSVDPAPSASILPPLSDLVSAAISLTRIAAQKQNNALCLFDLGVVSLDLRLLRAGALQRQLTWPGL